MQGKTSATLPVSEIMTPESKLMTVAPDQNVLEVMYLMNSNNFRHVPVVSFLFESVEVCGFSMFSSDLFD